MALRSVSLAAWDVLWKATQNRGMVSFGALNRWGEEAHKSVAVLEFGNNLDWNSLPTGKVGMQSQKAAGRNIEASLGFCTMSGTIGTDREQSVFRRRRS